MHVVWKRPDGFHDSSPEDFKVAHVADGSKIWLHKTDHKWFPFRIAGGWQESDATSRLNRLVNLVGEDFAHWSNCLMEDFHNSMKDQPELFFDETLTWLQGLKNHLKGDTWEVEIMGKVITAVIDKLSNHRADFIAKVKLT